MTLRDHDITDYPTLVSRFRWALPERLNMAVEVCDRWAEADPEKTAIVDLSNNDRRDVSYADLRGMADRLAHHLVACGVTRGDRVGVLRSQSPWTAAAHIAIWKIGAVSIPLFLLFGPDALRTRLTDAAARAVVTDAEGLALLDPLRQDLETLETVLVPNDGLPETGPFHAVETEPDDPAVLIYTSGTTGSPKGALHGHRVLRGHLPGVELSHDLLPRPGDVLWTPADWAWIGGLFDVLMPGLWHGVPVVAARLPKFSVEACLDVIRRGGIRNVFFPPTALRMLRAQGATIDGLRSVACGGEPLGADMRDWGREALGVTINEFYGQTECNMTLSCCAALFDSAPGVTGRPVPGQDIAVIDAAGQRIEGREGDIAVRRGTPVMFLGYWNNPQATAAKFLGDWMLTGDRGIQEGAAIRFMARTDDVITSGGYRIGPAEIEDCLMAHPMVAQVGVTGKPDALRTEIVKAYVVLKPDVAPDAATRTALQSHVRDRLAKYEYPREIAFVEALPMTVTGKIIRKDLRARAAAEAEAAA